MVYLFVGDDEFSKDIKLESLKKECFEKKVSPFNFDLLYARELSLKKLQESLLRLPFKAKKRIILIRGISQLKEPLKEYLASYVKKPSLKTLLILDVAKFDKKDRFLNRISRFTKISRFKESESPDTFGLSREINKKNINSSLKILRQLFLNGARPEKIIAGLRYCWDSPYLSLSDKKKRLSLLLNCDLEIKKGKLKPQVALEKLLVGLCCF